MSALDMRGLTRFLCIWGIFLYLWLKQSQASPMCAPFEDLKEYGERYKRATTQYYIDVLPVVGLKLYDIWLNRTSGDVEQGKTKILAYLTHTFASVKARFRTLIDPTGDAELIVGMVEPFIITTDAQEFSSDLVETETSGFQKVNATKLLHAFEDWLPLQTLPAYDHAMFFSGYPLHGSTDSGSNFNYTEGLANVGMLCQGPLSVSVIEDKGAYQSEATAAHELGHSCGSKHDGQGNLCSSNNRYVMTNNFNYIQTPANLLNPWKFSTCSSASIFATVQTILGQDSLRPCLFERVGEMLNDSSLYVYPDDICKDFYGAESYVCRGVGIASISELCTQFYCKQPHTDLCVKIAAPTGTCCGNNKGCLAGKCTDVSESTECVMDVECPLGDQPGIVVSSHTCDDMPSFYCYDDSVRAKCCTTCRKHKIDKAGCTYGDKTLGCQKDQCGATTTQSGASYKFSCCHTCENVNCLDLDLINDKTCAQYVADTGISECYREVVAKDCCATCEKVRDKTNHDCPFGDNLVIENCTILPTLQRECTSQEDQICCKTCPKTKPTTQRPTTASTTSSSNNVPSTDSSNNNNNQNPSPTPNTNSPSTDSNNNNNNNNNQNPSPTPNSNSPSTDSNNNNNNGNTSPANGGSSQAPQPSTQPPRRQQSNCKGLLCGACVLQPAWMVILLSACGILAMVL